MKIGYIRVSTQDQSEDRQIDALLPICDEIHIEKCSAIAKSRPVYEQVRAQLKPGDSFVVWDLDRAWRSTRDAVNEYHALCERGIDIQIASKHIDTQTPIGKLFFTILSGVAEYELDQLKDRTKQGLLAARKRGKRIGRPPKLSPKQLVAAKRQIAKGAPVTDLANSLGVHPSTLRRSLNRTEN